MEKFTKRNNIIIKGANLPAQNVSHSMQDFIKTKLEKEAKVKMAYEIRWESGIQMIVAELETISMKQEIMAKLRGLKVYIDQDRSKKERDIQREVRKIAEKENNKSSRVRIGYQKLFVSQEYNIWIGMILKHANQKN